MDNKEFEYNLHLISNASMDVYPNNVTSEFTTKLSKELFLPGTWEVGMISASYHNNMVNVLENEGGILLEAFSHDPLETANNCENSPPIVFNHFQLPDLKGKDEGIAPPMPSDINKHCLFYLQAQFYLPTPGNYCTPNSFLDAVNELYYYSDVTKTRIYLKDFVKFVFNSSTQKITAFDVQHPDKELDRRCQIIKLTLSDKLCKILGLSQGNSFLTRVSSEIIFDLSLPLLQQMFQSDTSSQKTHFEFPDTAMWVQDYNLLIYTDIVQQSMLGNVDAAYLNIIPVTGREGEYIYFEPHTPIYKKIDKTRLHSIHIKVAGINGERVKFNHGSGEFLIHLHLRRVN